MNSWSKNPTDASKKWEKKNKLDFLGVYFISSDLPVFLPVDLEINHIETTTKVWNIDKMFENTLQFRFILFYPTDLISSSRFYYVAKFILQHIVLHSGFSSLFFFLFWHVWGHIFVTNEDFFTKFGLQVKQKNDIVQI